MCANLILIMDFFWKISVSNSHIDLLKTSTNEKDVPGWQINVDHGIFENSNNRDECVWEKCGKDQNGWYGYKKGKENGGSISTSLSGAGKAKLVSF